MQSPAMASAEAASKQQKLEPSENAREQKMLKDLFKPAGELHFTGLSSSRKLMPPCHEPHRRIFIARIARCWAGAR